VAKLEQADNFGQTADIMQRLYILAQKLATKNKDSQTAMTIC